MMHVCKSPLYPHLFLLPLLGKRGRWFDELTKILHYHLKDPGTASKVCAEALDSVNEPFVLTGFKRSIEHRQRRIKKLKPLKELPTERITLHAVKVFSETGKKALYVRKHDKENSSTITGVTVEQLAIDYFQEEQDHCVGADDQNNTNINSDANNNTSCWKAVHSENSALTTLFALLFFDIIFLDTIPGVFVSPFQTRPLDLNSEFFYILRRTQIDERLKMIREGGFMELILKVDESERSRRTLCVGLNWDLFSRQDLVDICMVRRNTPLLLYGGRG
jgi:hypothetical protein